MSRHARLVDRMAIVRGAAEVGMASGEPIVLVRDAMASVSAELGTVGEA